MTVLQDPSVSVAAQCTSQPVKKGQSTDEAFYLGCAFNFSSHDEYLAKSDVLQTRSEKFFAPFKQVHKDVWSIQPPDFRPQNYLPKPPKRNSRDSMQPSECIRERSIKTINFHKKYHEKKIPNFLESSRPKGIVGMDLVFDILTADGARKLAVKEGFHPKEKYVNPRPHNFRQYTKEQGLPELCTSKSPDPFDLEFKRKNLDIYHGVPQPLRDEYLGIQMGHPLSPQPKYDPSLFLPRDKWPSIPQEFTRHRPRVRTPNTVLLDKVEETLTKRWAQEKNERILIEKEQKKKKQRFAHKDGVNKARNVNFCNEFDMVCKHDGSKQISSSKRNFSSSLGSRLY